MPQYLKIPDVALAPMLNSLINRNFIDYAGSGLQVDLFTSNLTPAAGDTLSTYSGNKPTFSGYSTFTVLGWNVPVVTASVAETTSTTDATYTLTATLGTAVICYGYFVWQTVAGIDGLAWAQRFDAPLVFINNGDSYHFPIVFDFLSQH
jgi:hypothetical protein